MRYQSSSVTAMIAGLILATGTVAHAQTVYSDTFTYSNGDLNGNGGWTEAANPNFPATDPNQRRIHVDTNQLKLDFGQGLSNTSTVFHAGKHTVSVTACPTGDLITVSLKMMRAGTPGSGNVYSIEFNGSTGTNMARWYGGADSALCRNGSKVGAASQPISNAAFDELRAEITPATRTTKYYFNNTLTDTLVWPTDVGSPTTITSINIIHNNLTGKSGILFIDDVIITRCPGSCTTDVTPPGIFAAASVGQPAQPVSQDFTFSNTSTAIDITYTAAETDASGTPFDYPWLSVSPASGPVGHGATAPITATINSAALSAGTYVGYIKFTDSCNPNNAYIRYVLLVVGSLPCFVEKFPYPNGNLGGNDDWIGGNGGVLVNSEAVTVVVDDGSPGVLGTVASIPTSCGACEDGKITVTARVKGAPSNGQNSWNLYFLDTAGHQLARWFGTSSSIQPRIQVIGLPQVNLTNSAFDDLRMVIDTVANTTTYYFTPNGGSEILVGTLSHGSEVAGQSGVTDTIGSVQIERLDRSEGDGATGNPTVDDIYIYGCQGSCFAAVNNKNTFLPWALNENSAAVPPSLDYRVTNNGLDNLSYSTVEAAAGGSAFDYPWLSLTNPAGGPLTPGGLNVPAANGLVTANISSTGLETGAQLGYLKFTDDCNPNQSFIRSIKLNINHCISDTFPFPDGDLQGNPAWVTDTPLGVSSPISMIGGVVRLNGATTVASTNARHINIDNCPVCDTSGIVIVRVKVRGTTGGSGSRFWRLKFFPLGNTPLAQWEGSATYVDAAANGALSSNLTGGGQFDLLEARINNNSTDLGTGGNLVPALTARYFFNGQLVGDGGAVGSGARVRRITLDMDSNAANDTTPIVELDDLIVTRCGPPTDLFCGDPVFDVRDGSNNQSRDGMVGDRDFDVFSGCVTGPAVVNLSLSAECKCFDLDNNNIIDMDDYARFQRCYSGSTAADPDCDDNP